MNCPACGKSIEEGQNFCRDCGAQLTERSRISRRQVAGLGVMFLIFGGLIAAMFGKMMDTRWLIFAGVIVMFFGMFMIAAFGVMRELRPRKRVVKMPDTPALIPSVEKVDTTNKLLPIGQNDYVPSVVENTTDLLEPAANKQKKIA